MAAKINRVSFSLEPEYYELLEKIARKMYTNKTVELRKMIDSRAVELGLKPIAPVSGTRTKQPATGAGAVANG